MMAARASSGMLTAWGERFMMNSPTTDWEMARLAAGRGFWSPKTFE